MADKNLLQVDGGQIVTPTGARFYAITPDGGSPTGWQDNYIDEADLHSALQGQITVNAGNITTNQTDITALQNLTKKDVTLSTGTYSFTLPADSRIEGFTFYWISGASVTVTVTSGATTISGAKTLDSTAKTLWLTNAYNSDKASSKNITITITGGLLDSIIFYREDLTVT